MENLNNPQLIIDFIESFPEIQSQFDSLLEEMNHYLKFIKIPQIEKKENETKEEALRRAESTLDRIKEVVIRRQTLNAKRLEIQNALGEMRKKIDAMAPCCRDNDDNLADINNDTIDEIIEIRKQIMEEEIQKNPEKSEEIKKEFEMYKNDFMKQIIDGGKVKKLRLKEKKKEKKAEQKAKKEEQKQNEYDQLIEVNERQQLEQWTGKKCGDIIFNSDKDNWNIKTSVFEGKVFNRSNVAVIIEDTNGNKFGGYVSSTIDKYEKWFNDANTFVFSLKSNGRINGMKKFNAIEPELSYYQYRSKSGVLVCFGGGRDISVSKKDSGENYCNQKSFNYEGISNALCGAYNFTTKRIIVVQMN